MKILHFVQIVFIYFYSYGSIAAMGFMLRSPENLAVTFVVILSGKSGRGGDGGKN